MFAAFYRLNTFAKQELQCAGVNVHGLTLAVKNIANKKPQDAAVVLNALTTIFKVLLHGFYYLFEQLLVILVLSSTGRNSARRSRDSFSLLRACELGDFKLLALCMDLVQFAERSPLWQLMVLRLLFS
jgi:hypothetical protein